LQKRFSEKPGKDIRMSRKVHLIGIAGSGMSGLARWYLNLGWQVSGCDRSPGETGRCLQELGIEVFNEHSPSHLDGVDRVVWTAAMPDDNPELMKASTDGIPLFRRSEALAELTREKRLIAIGGAHGKTTTTAMTGWILQETGMDPTVFLGGFVSRWNGNFRSGGDLTVVEADEYDRAFLRLQPDVAAVTSFAAEHLECYGSVDALEEAFGFFLESTLPGGGVVVPVERRDLAHWAERIGRIVLTAGPGGDVWCTPHGRDGNFERFSLGGFEGRLPVPGIHNLRNASTAAGICQLIGIGFSESVAALSTFPGVARRLESLGERNGLCVLSDYAHHPDEMAAAIEAVRRMVDGRIAVVFQPHLYSRTSIMHEEMGKALLGCDRSFVLPIYPAREEPIPGIESGLVVESAVAGGGCSTEVDPAVIGSVLDAELEGYAAVVFMGAGTVDGIARSFVRGEGNAPH
jgi:UDP-N-acetylmuramate--alanine ligase